MPPGCGPYSGTLVPANTLDDHSNDNAPPAYQVAAAGHITVGTRFDDHITGTAGVDIICGLAKRDFIQVGAGADVSMPAKGPAPSSGRPMPTS